MRRIVLFLLLCVCGLTLFSGCAKNNPNAFITFIAVSDDSLSIKLGMSKDQMNFTEPQSGNPLNDNESQFKRKWANGNDFSNLVAVINFGTVWRTSEGISLNNTKADVLPAYQKETDIKILQNDDSKIILGKQISGVNYTATFRFYPNGDIKYITLINADLYTDDDADYK